MSQSAAGGGHHGAHLPGDATLLLNGCCLGVIAEDYDSLLLQLFRATSPYHCIVCGG